jgi:hypothetical protein
MAERKVPGPYPPEEMDDFLATYMYRDDAFLVDEVLRLDGEAREIEGRLCTGRGLPYADLQRSYAGHVRHVAAGDLLMATGSLGCLHAWFFHGCRWSEGWAGFGGRVHRGEFKSVAIRGPDLILASRETRARVNPERVVLRYEFHFRQEGRLVYFGDQTAVFLRTPTSG